MAGEERSVKVKIDHVEKIYEGRNGKMIALNGVDFEIKENEFICVVGPSGCGKSTLLNIIAGLLEPTSGAVYVDGKKVEGTGIERGVVFQQYALFPWKTVIQNVEMNQKFKGMNKAERREQAQQYIKLVGLEGFENKYPAQLSGGMKQRVGIARAYATNSDIILMDEPFGALDAQTRYQMQEEILRIWEQKKVTIVFITNNVEEAVTLGDRIVLLSNKPCRVVEEFVPDMPRPRNNMDAQFLALRNEIASKVDLAL